MRVLRYPVAVDIMHYTSVVENCVYIMEGAIAGECTVRKIAGQVSPQSAESLGCLSHMCFVFLPSPERAIIAVQQTTSLAIWSFHNRPLWKPVTFRAHKVYVSPQA